MTAEHQSEPAELGPVHTDDELLARWRLLLQGEPYDSRALWVTWYDGDDMQAPVVVPIHDLPGSPDPAFVDNLARVVGEVLGDNGGWVSLALVRPGPGLISPDDRAWAVHLKGAMARSEVECRPLFLATAGRIRQLVLDDL
jgi:hypothetical protein